MRKIWFISFGFGLLCCLYFGGVLLFTDHAPFRTYVNGKSVFMCSESEIVLDVMTSVSKQKLTFLRRDGTSESMTFGSLGIHLKDTPKQSDFHINPWLWFTHLFYRLDMTVDSTLDCDETQLRTGIRKLECISGTYVKEPDGATIRKNADGDYEIDMEQAGNEIDEDALLETVQKAVKDGKRTVDLESAGVYVTSAIYQQEHDEKASRTREELLSENIDLIFGAGKTEKIPSGILKESVYESEDGTYVHYAMIYAYMAYLGRTYNTIGKDRLFTTTDGNELTLSPGPDDTFIGWDLDYQESAKAVVQALAKGEKEVSLVWKHVGSAFDGTQNDFGDTYVELSIQAQHMWVYKKGKLLLETDVTTGLDSVASRRTPTGMFMTMDWNLEYTMHGSYGTAFSHYFIRITPTGIGIHDSSWRSQYGGDVYLTDGSHGCINTPYEKVVQFYDEMHEFADVGIPVIIY